MGEPWLDSLSEDWDSEPRLSSPASSLANSKYGSHTSRASQSRIPHLAHSMRRESSGSFLKPRSSRGIAKSKGMPALSERSASSLNLPGSISQHGPPRKSAPFTAPRQASSNFSSSQQSVQHHTVSHSPNEAPEWKRRIQNGEDVLSDGFDLFSPSKLEGIFAQPAHAASDQENQNTSIQKESKPWTSLRQHNTSQMSTDKFQSFRTSRSRGAPMAALLEMNEEEEGGADDRHDHGMSSISSELVRSGSMRGLVQRRVSDSEESHRVSGALLSDDSVMKPLEDPRLRTTSGRQEARNEVISPLTVSTKNTISARAVRNSIDLDLEVIKKKLMDIRTECERPSSRSSDREVSYNGQGLGDESVLHEESLQDVTSHSLPEDLSMGTQDFISHGGYVNPRRGPAPDEASFLRAKLSSIDESFQCQPEPTTFTKFRSSPPPYDTLVGGIEQNDSSEDHSSTPRDESIIHHDQSPQRPASAGSPLKLFGNRDTYTNNKLLRVLSQYEQAKSDQSQSTESLLKEPSQLLAFESDLRMSQFGKGELDTYNFEKEVARPAMEKELLLVEGNKIFQSFADLTIDDEGTIPDIRPPLRPNIDRDIGGPEVKRTPSSPGKERTPKRRRTLIRDEKGRQDVGEEIMTETRRDHVQEKLSLAGTKRKDARPGEGVTQAEPNVLAARSILQPRPGSRKTSGQSQYRSNSQDSTIKRVNPPSELAEALAAELASFAQGVSQAHHDSRKPSLATKDYMEEANKVMEFIRARGKPKQQLPEIQEPMDATELDADKILDLEIDDDSTAEPFSRPPSREGPIRSREDRRIAKHDSQTANHLQKFKDSDDLDLLPGTLVTNPLQLHGESENQASSPVLVEKEESQPANIRILDSKESQRQVNPSPSLTNDHTNTVPLSEGSTRRTFATESSNISGQKGVISCGKVSIPDNVGTMTFDHEKQIWVHQQLSKMKQRRSQSLNQQTPRQKLDEHTLDDDPFANIPDLSIDEVREAAMRVAPRSSRPSTAETVLVAPPSSGEGGPNELSDPVEGQSQEELQESTQPSRQDKVELSTDVAQAETNENGELLLQQSLSRSSEVSRHEERLHQGIPSKLPFTQSSLSKQPRVVTIAFSSPVASEIPQPVHDVLTSVSDDEDFLPPEDSDDDVDFLRTPHVKPQLHHVEHTWKDRSTSGIKERLQHRTDILSRRPVSRIEERDEDVEQIQNSSLLHLEASKALTPAAGRQMTTTKQISAYKGMSILSLTPLSEFTMHQDDRANHPEESFVQERVHPKALLQAHGALALSVDTLIKAITDAVEGEPFWEQIQKLNLKDSRLQSVHGLGDYCSMLEVLDISQNQIGQLDGLPASLRQIDVSHNKVNDFTPWSHLPNLQYVDVSENQLENLEGFSSLVHLRKLKCARNAIRDIEGVIDLDGLISLDLQHNQLSELDFEGSVLPRLEELDLSGNRLTTIRNLHHLASLRKLNLSGNNLRELYIPEPLILLKELAISDNALENLDIAMFPALSKLNLDNNTIKSIKGLQSAQRLRTLSLRNQRDSSAIIDMVLSMPNECSEIYLSSNNLSHGQLRLPKFPHYNLKTLELAACGLRSLPAGFGDYFPNCRTLNLNFNAISELSPLVGTIKLQRLLVAGNRIKRLRRTCLALSKLPQLVTLDVRDNPLTVGFSAPDHGDEEKSSGYLLSQRSLRHDVRWLELMDETTALKRKMMELLLVEGCQKLEELDGLPFDKVRMSKRDTVWDHLTSKGVLMKTIEAPPLHAQTQPAMERMMKGDSPEEKILTNIDEHDIHLQGLALERSVMME